MHLFPDGFKLRDDKFMVLGYDKACQLQPFCRNPRRLAGAPPLAHDLAHHVTHVGARVFPLVMLTIPCAVCVAICPCLDASDDPFGVIRWCMISPEL